MLLFGTDTSVQDSRCCNRVPPDEGSVWDPHGGQAIILIAFLSNPCSLAYLSPGMDQSQLGWAHELHHSPSLEFCQMFRWFVHLKCYCLQWSLMLYAGFFYPFLRLGAGYLRMSGWFASTWSISWYQQKHWRQAASSYGLPFRFGGWIGLLLSLGTF